jgi:hypothetical protein
MTGTFLKSGAALTMHMAQEHINDKENNNSSQATAT